MRDDRSLAVQPDQPLHRHREHEFDYTPGLDTGLQACNEHAARGKVERSAAVTGSIDVDVDVSCDVVPLRVAPLVLHVPRIQKRRPNLNSLAPPRTP